MQCIQNRDVATEWWRCRSDVMLSKLEPVISRRSDLHGFANLSFIEIQSRNRLLKGALAQVKPKKPQSASDIEQRFARVLQKLVDGRVRRIAPKFAHHIISKPAPAKMPRD